MNNSRNLILAVVLSALLLFGWDAAMGWLYPQPVEVQQAEKVDTPAENAALANNGTNGGTVGTGPAAPTVDLATALRGVGGGGEEGRGRKKKARQGAEGGVGAKKKKAGAVMKKGKQ